jgi:nicotinate phosphoribosyltransferase
MAQSYFVHRKCVRATFDLFVRQLPENRSYLVACGLEDILKYIRELKFGEEDICFLREKKVFRESFLEYLARFRFTGDIWAMPEGTVFFAEEPVIRITAPIIEGQLIESFLLNTVNLESMIASKASRVACAAGDRGLYDFSLRRTHGAEAGIKVARLIYRGFRRDL